MGNFSNALEAPLAIASGVSCVASTYQAIHFSPFLEAQVDTVAAVTNKIIRNDGVGIIHECRTPPSGVKRAGIELGKFLGGWFSHSKWGDCH